jgi:enoyl-CoA hydratase
MAETTELGGPYAGFRLEREGPVLRCVFNRPELLNAFDPEIFDEIARLCKVVGPDKDIRVVIVTGEGKAFCVGGNVKKFASGETDSQKIIRDAFLTHHEHPGFLGLPQPTIAMINGDAIGGGLIHAMQCDILVASSRARLGFGYAKIGLSHSAGIISLTPLMTSLNLAKEYMFTGELIPAEEALRIGLVNHVYPAEELEQRTAELARKIVEVSPVSTRYTKLLLNKEIRKRSVEFDVSSDALVALAAGMNDYAEATRAITERRKPKFTGS